MSIKPDEIYPENEARGSLLENNLREVGRKIGSETIVSAEFGQLGEERTQVTVAVCFIGSLTPPIEYHLSPGVTIIGRNHQCDIVIPEQCVSRVQCALTLHSKGQIEIRDLDSYNGMWFKMERVEHLVFQPDEGGELTLGTRAILMIKRD